VVELARILLGIGEYGEAAARCRDALARAAGEPLASPVVEADLHEGLGLALAKAGDLGDARAQLERALELEPGRARAWANLGRCHHLLGEPERAAEAYERSLALDPDCWEAARNFAELLVERRETGRAEALLRIWAAHQPEDPHAVLSLGELLTAAPGREDDAATVLAAALERHPDDPRIHALLGGILTQTGELARAERHYREALRLDPGDPALMSNLAVVLSQRGALREAEQLARQAVEVDPHDPISRKIFDHVRKLN
jgi:Flp pilus assembly protein TadD